MKKLVIAVLFMFSLVCAADVSVACSGMTCPIATGVSWSNANNVWIITPPCNDCSMYVYIHNNNTSSGHTLALSAFSTPFTQVGITLTGNPDRWIPTVLIQNPNANQNCTSLPAAAVAIGGAMGVGSCYSYEMNTAKIALQITTATAASGSPDTFDIAVVFSQHGAGGPAPGGDSNTGSSTVAAQVQGTVFPGGNAALTNPVVLGGLDGSSNNQPFSSFQFGANGWSSAGFGLKTVTAIASFDGSNYNIAGNVGNANTTNTPGIGLIPLNGTNNVIPIVASSVVEGSHVIKATASALYSAEVTTGATAGVFMIFNTTSAPADGAVAPAFCAQVAANSTFTKDWLYPVQMNNGTVFVFSSGTNCFNKAASATAHFLGLVK